MSELETNSNLKTDISPEKIPDTTKVYFKAKQETLETLKWIAAQFHTNQTNALERSVSVFAFLVDQIKSKNESGEPHLKLYLYDSDTRKRREILLNLPKEGQTNTSQITLAEEPAQESETK